MARNIYKSVYIPQICSVLAVSRERHLMRWRSISIFTRWYIQKRNSKFQMFYKDLATSETNILDNVHSLLRFDWNKVKLYTLHCCFVTKNRNQAMCRAVLNVKSNWRLLRIVRTEPRTSNTTCSCITTVLRLPLR